ncbi:MAG: TonB family protein [Acidobacteriota bacterium]|nr:TonB family protein [Acidobacteriota bacterium]
MSKRIVTFTFTAVSLALASGTALAQSNLTAKASAIQPAPASAVAESDRVRDGLVGPVRRVRTEIAKLSNESGKLLEGKHVVLEVVAYDIKGNKTENQYFPMAGANLTGKEVYKYDEKGNISEMTLVNADGSLLSKEVYKYEFDFAGNWNRMTTSVAVIEAGKMSFEPNEITYRSIMYYLDENMMKMAQPVVQPAPMPANNVANTSVAVVNSETKNEAVASKPAVNNASASQKSAGLPSARVSSDKLNNMAEVDAGNLRSNTSAQPPVVRLDSEPPPAARPKPILRPVTGGVLNGTAISLPAPMYPETARRLRMSGLVTVEVIVDETGKVISAQATSGPAALREVAAQAAMRAKFSPTKLSGQPVKVSGLITYKFSLAQ